MVSSRWLLVLLAISSCAPSTESGLFLTVELSRDLRSKGARVFVHSVTKEAQTAPIALKSRTRLDVGVVQGNLPQTITVQAVGYGDEACTTETTPAERSEVVTVHFVANKVVTANLTLGRVNPKTETACGNGLDDDQDSLVDCADDDCDGQPCTTGNPCVKGQRCANHTCSGGLAETCSTAPSSCFQAPGVCVQGDDGGCRFQALPGASCDDSNPCTELDTCNAQGACLGGQKVCTQTSNACLAMSGTCSPDGGCEFAVTPGARCDDADPCTVGDACLAGGGCAGITVTCGPRECGVFASACDADGGCLYQPVDAGLACDGGVCNSSGACISTFPYPPSNFTSSQVPNPPGPVTYGCGVTVIDTHASGAPTITNGCGQPVPGWADLTLDGGPAALLLAYSSLEVSADAGVRITGARPAIIAVTASAHIFGDLIGESGSDSCAAGGAGFDGQAADSFGGAGGAGYATAGAPGGMGGTPFLGTGGAGGDGGAPNGEARLVPLRGGCPGGRGGDLSLGAAAGGGGLQISVARDLTVRGAVGAPGRGGAGGQANLFGKPGAGNGGGSGGSVLLEAYQIVLVSTAAVTANGGGGGQAGGSLDNGQSGGSGAVRDATPAPGGAGVLLAGPRGGAGATSSALPEGGADGFSAVGGGGAGGAEGRVRFNTATTCDLGPQVVLSPAPTSNVADAGCP